MDWLKRALMGAAGAGVICVGAWAQLQGTGSAHAAAQPAPVLHDGSYQDFTLTERDRASRLSPDYQTCMARARAADAVRSCTSQEQARLTELMEAAFRNAVGRITVPAVRDRLRADQARWQQGRQAQCQRPTAGSGEICALHELVRRTTWLEQHR